MSYFEKTRVHTEKEADGTLVLEEMLEEILKQLKIINLHLEMMTENQITEEEIE